MDTAAGSMGTWGLKARCIAEQSYRAYDRCGLLSADATDGIDSEA
jgi:hypothetical protein